MTDQSLTKDNASSIPSEGVGEPFANKNTSFADKIRNTTKMLSIDLATLPSPGKRGDYPAISIPEELHRKSLEALARPTDGKIDEVHKRQPILSDAALMEHLSAPPSKIKMKKAAREANTSSKRSTTPRSGGISSSLKQIVRIHSPDLIWISEPMIHFSNSFCTRLRLRMMSTDAIHNSTNTRKGNIWLLWKDSLPRPVVISSSTQAISVEVDNSIVTGVHAHVLTINRRDLWNQLIPISQLNKPWLLIGDFNAVLRIDEKKGGLLPKANAMSDFWECVNTCNLIESQSTGIKYTWCNNQIGHRRILCKLDRAFFNSAWSNHFGNWSIKALTRSKSDHSPLVGSTTSIPKPHNAPFRFQKMWLTHTKFLDTTKHSWDTPIAAGNKATRFAYKLKRLKEHLKWWNINVFGDINQKMQNLEKVVHQAMQESDDDPDNLDKLSHLLQSQRDLDVISSQYDTFIGQKAKIKWINEGERNTRYLHTSIKVRRNNNQILQIIDDDGRMWSSQPDIKANIVKHYEEKFKKTRSDNVPSLLTVIPKSISAQDNTILDTIPPKAEGGLGLVRLEILNKALLSKLMWRIYTSKENWAKFLRAKFQSRCGNWINYYKQSSIWGGLRWAISNMKDHLGWIIGDGKSINLWSDTWCSTVPIADMIDLDSNILHLKGKVSDLIVDGIWSIPLNVADILNSAGININSLPPPSMDNDTLVWKPSLDGCYSVSNGINLYREKLQKPAWPAKIWRHCIHPKRSVIAWKILSGCCATDARIQSRGIQLASRCFLCHSDGEDDRHIFWDCKFVVDIWTWVIDLFGFRRPLDPLNFNNLVECATNRSAAIQDLWTAAITYVITEVWLHRNSCVFENKRTSSHRVKQKILANFLECSILMKSDMHNRVSDLMIFSSLKIIPRPVVSSVIHECFWIPPAIDQLKIGCDGCSRGNPGNAGAGIVLRDHRGSTLGAMAVGLGICTNFVAEVLAILLGLEWAKNLGWTNIWVTSDSQAAIRCFIDNKVPWFILTRWNSVKEGIRTSFSFVFRETNFAADTMSKRGAYLPLGTKESFDYRPTFLSVENPDSCYYRFS
ncbi:Ribonuclease H domain [Macleaya cordata]|uniref:Ribonuclease H domain n=1 Tax=Macleaya cordata TaxID=56857 RepID=A0A200Q7W9_MACCD|nr:Ribonuclease H domain [Macleaya cordata]